MSGKFAISQILKTTTAPGQDVCVNLSNEQIRRPWPDWTKVDCLTNNQITSANAVRMGDAQSSDNRGVKTTPPTICFSVGFDSETFRSNLALIRTLFARSTEQPKDSLPSSSGTADVHATQCNDAHRITNILAADKTDKHYSEDSLSGFVELNKNICTWRMQNPGLLTILRSQLSCCPFNKDSESPPREGSVHDNSYQMVNKLAREWW
ncbi:hypothetical protein CRM22_009636 [Opisthorchis felineus]|uniref:Uncharacterized protein n=1 Tax=Opisthorchis felineus TaxID=147828 RepID=A0A4S2L6W2_OPIFE|nr:hypothetical protein CRM22_009636 [Opisthorchis felineus]